MVLVREMRKPACGSVREMRKPACGTGEGTEEASL